MMIDRGSPIVMGSLRGLPTVLGSEPCGPSFHDVKSMSALAPMLLIYTAREAMVTKKVAAS